MKKLTTLSIAVFAFALAAIAQTPVYLNFNHYFGTEPLEYKSTAGVSGYIINRLDYYVSDISIQFNDGTDTTLSDVYILVHGNENSMTHIADLNNTDIKSISFGIGVDAAVNHEDPSTYANDHALYHQMPSMHWGWSAGYRFVAIEGLTGGKDQTWSIHALGDKNYGHATINTSGKMDNGDLVFIINADYEKALENISVNANLNYHGEDGVTPVFLANFQNSVFSEGQTPINVTEVNAKHISVFPNPSNGFINIQGFDQNTSIEIVDLSGKVVYQHTISLENEQLSLNNVKAGAYLFKATSANEVPFVQTLIIQ